MSITTLPIAEPAGFDVPPLSVRRFTVEEYERMGETGVLTEDDSVELLEGLIVRKITKNPLHDWTIDYLTRILGQGLPHGWLLRIQNVLRTDDSEPEPDVVIAIGDLFAFRRQHPTGRESVLVIEVAETSLDQDWRKCRIYARANVPQYWIVDLTGRCVEVFTRPNPSTGKYEDHVRRVAPEVLTVVLAPNALLNVNLQELLPDPGK
jgi:Uma2 family endonuclease